MSFGKMNAFIDVIQTEQTKDTDGFVTSSDTVLASVRAYREDRHGNEIWANRAAWSSATSLFCFRRIPGVEIRPSLLLVCSGERFRILSAEDVRGRGMYIEVLAERLEPSKH
ncbi:head-tail adaptor protein [Caproicibacter sp.]|uniref:head-tail adaptor protein n=1 Tax=Caproicibacter sp. TaxID=2814884 RepID=UPI0039893489